MEGFVGTILLWPADSPPPPTYFESEKRKTLHPYFAPVFAVIRCYYSFLIIFKCSFLIRNLLSLAADSDRRKRKAPKSGHVNAKTYIYILPTKIRLNSFAQITIIISISITISTFIFISLSLNITILL